MKRRKWVMDKTKSKEKQGFLADNSLEKKKMGGEGQVIGVHTIDAWNEQLQKANENKKLVVVDFAASWCGPCRAIAPFLSDLAKKFPIVTFLKVDVDELKTVAADWAVEAMPTFIFIKEGSILDRVVGAKKDQLQVTLGKHMGTTSA